MTITMHPHNVKSGDSELNFFAREKSLVLNFQEVYIQSAYFLSDASLSFRICLVLAVSYKSPKKFRRQRKTQFAKLMVICSATDRVVFLKKHTHTQTTVQNV